MFPAGSLQTEEQCHTGLLTACEQEQMLLLLLLLKMGKMIARNMLS